MIFERTSKDIVLLKLTSPKSETPIYCGLSDKSTYSHVIFCPSYFFGELNIDNSDQIKIDLVDLPKCTHILFSVPSYIKDPKPILED